MSSTGPGTKALSPFPYIRSFDVYAEVLILALASSVGAPSKSGIHGSAWPGSGSPFDVRTVSVLATVIRVAASASHGLSVVTV